MSKLVLTNVVRAELHYKGERKTMSNYIIRLEEKKDYRDVEDLVRELL